MTGVHNSMDMNRLSSIIAAPLASLFLILCVCSILLQRPVSAGIPMPLPKMVVYSNQNCIYGDDRSVVLQLHRDGSTKINETPIPRNVLQSDLSLIYENRFEKVIYIFPDPDVSFQQFADIYNLTKRSTDGLHILTSSNFFDREMNKCPSGKFCGFTFSNQKQNDCYDTIFPPVMMLPQHPARN